MVPGPGAKRAAAAAAAAADSQVEGQAKIQNTLLDHHVTLAEHGMKREQMANESQQAQQDFAIRQMEAQQKAAMMAQQGQQGGNA